MVAQVQCSSIQFNPNRLVETSEDTPSRRLGPVFRVVTSFEPNAEEAAAMSDLDGSEDTQESEESAPEKVGESTFVLASGAEEGSNAANGTFVLEEENSNGTFSLSPQAASSSSDSRVTSADPNSTFNQTVDHSTLGTLAARILSSPVLNKRPRLESPEKENEMAMGMTDSLTAKLDSMKSASSSASSAAPLQPLN